MDEFEIGFWHPFGPHAGETPDDIITRKRGELTSNSGWTLWSFQSRTAKTFAAWHRTIAVAHPRSVFVFCADSDDAIDPDRDGTSSVSAECGRFQFFDGDGGETHWQQMPSTVRVRHPFRPGKRLASAFVVQQILYPSSEFERPLAEWLDITGVWRQERVPTRGEYLIRRGGSTPIRGVKVVLKLKPPYLATIAADAP